MAIVREREIDTLEQLNVTPLAPWELIVGKLRPKRPSACCAVPGQLSAALRVQRYICAEHAGPGVFVSSTESTKKPNRYCVALRMWKTAASQVELSQRSPAR